MQNIRPVSEKKWDIINHAFYQAYHFAMRYLDTRQILLVVLSLEIRQDLE